MAIKRKTDSQGPVLPEVFTEMVRKALTLQQISDKYEKAFKSEKETLVTYLGSNTDGVEVTAGETLQTPFGGVLYTSRASFDFDLVKLEKMIKDGEMTLATFMAISSVSATKLKAAVGDAKFKTLATESSTEYLTLKASSEFKSEIDAMFSVDLTPIATPAAIALPQKPEAKPMSSLEKAKMAQAKAVNSAPKRAKPSASVDSDLDAILKRT